MFKRALGVDPGDANARYYLKEVAQARVGQLLGWDETDEAAAYLTDLLTYAPDLAELHLLLGDVRYKQGEMGRRGESYANYLRLGGTSKRAVSRSREGQAE